MTDFEHYVLGEHVEDFNDGIISRRELLRRVTLITGSLTATLAVLDVMGCGSTPSGTQASPVSRASSSPQPFATPPAQPTTDGITVQPTDPRIKVETLTVYGKDGAQLMSYAAAPASGSAAGAILVVHENRGRLEHIKDVVRRVPTAGCMGLSIDLLSRDGGAGELSDQAACAAALAERAARPTTARARATTRCRRRPPGSRQWGGCASTSIRPGAGPARRPAHGAAGVAWDAHRCARPRTPGRAPLAQWTRAAAF